MKLSQVFVSVFGLVVVHFNITTLANGEIPKIEDIVVGTVSSVSDFKHEEPDSEHAAAWRQAVVHIERTLAGKDKNDDKDVIVRFATGFDSAWINAPRLTENERSIFMLRKDTVTGAGGDAYVVYQKDDVYRLEEYIILGKVTEIRDLPSKGPISQHSQQMKNAIVIIESVISGDKAHNEFENVEFDASTDIAHVDEPKLHVGERAILHLHPLKAGDPRIKMIPYGVESSTDVVEVK